jgi:hypothetical protein
MYDPNTVCGEWLPAMFGNVDPAGGKAWQLPHEPPVNGHVWQVEHDGPDCATPVRVVPWQYWFAQETVPFARA